MLMQIPVHAHAVCEQTFLSNNSHRPHSTAVSETKHEAGIVSDQRRSYLLTSVDSGEAAGKVSSLVSVHRTATLARHPLD